MEHFDLAIIGTGSGNSIPDPTVDAGTNRCASRSASRAPSAAPASTSAASRPRCSSTPPRSPKPSGTARDYGVDAHIDRVRWPDIVSRVFGRIDPIAAGGEEYKRGLPNVDGVRQPHPVRPDPARRPLHVAHRGRRRVHRRSGGDRRGFAGPHSRRRSPSAACDYHTSDTIMRIPELPEHLVIVGGGFVAAEFAHVFSALGVRVTIVVRGDGLLTHCDDAICHPFTDIGVAEVGSAHARERHRVANTTVTGSCSNSTTVKTLAADMLLVATGRVPNGDLLDAELAGVEVEGRHGASSTSTNAPRRAASSRSATCRRRISSSTSPTTRCAWCGTTCCATGTTPPRMTKTTIGSSRRRCSPTRRSPSSG